MVEISIPSSVVNCGKQIFNGVKNLDISGNLTKIHDILFDECSSLVSVIIPSSVVSIGNSSFKNCQ